MRANARSQLDPYTGGLMEIPVGAELETRAVVMAAQVLCRFGIRRTEAAYAVYADVSGRERLWLGEDYRTQREAVSAALGWAAREERRLSQIGSLV